MWAFFLVTQKQEQEEESCILGFRIHYQHQMDSYPYIPFSPPQIPNKPFRIHHPNKKTPITPSQIPILPYEIPNTSSQISKHYPKFINLNHIRWVSFKSMTSGKEKEKDVHVDSRINGMHCKSGSCYRGYNYLRGWLLFTLTCAFSYRSCDCTISRSFSWSSTLWFLDFCSDHAYC